MKRKLLFISTISLLSCSAFSQTVNNVPIKEIHSEYIQIKGNPVLLSNRLNILIDFGQYAKSLSTKDQVILDSSGKRMQFNSMIDALNFMSANGYDFVQAYGVAINNNEIEHYYLLRKGRK
ncbi:MAG: hypothetical protein JSS98_04165 [Bacteroidetes bacterium]|nr:hypothetical protein [Bacteroidota bacterium]